jgi:hypothetical protein
MPGTDGQGTKAVPSSFVSSTVFGKVRRYISPTDAIRTILLGAIGSLLAAYIWSQGEKSNVVTPPQAQGLATISFSEIPHILPEGQSAPSRWIKGEVKGVSDPKEYRVVVYSYTNQWYVQPTQEQPFTGITPAGQWQTLLQGGSYYAALLVRGEPPVPPSTLNLPTNLPQVVTWEITEGRSNLWNYFFMVLPYGITAVLLLSLLWKFIAGGLRRRLETEDR